MKRPAVFFDRDNTLIVCDGYLGDPTSVTLVSGAAGAVARVREMGFATVVVSNQSGVARGMFSEDDVAAVNSRIDEMLLAEDSKAVIDRHEFCAFHPEAVLEKYRQDNPRRKPAPGMILDAASELALDLERSWLIGDAPRDIEAGKAAGCRAILVDDPSVARSPAADAATSVKPDHVAASLGDAVEYIENWMNGTMTDPDDNPEAGGARAQSDALRNPPETPSSQGPEPGTSQNQLARIESFASQIVNELRKQREHAYPDFSVSKLLAGIVQVVSVAVLFLAYLNRGEDSRFYALMVFGVWLQALVTSLLIMSRRSDVAGQSIPSGIRRSGRYHARSPMGLFARLSKIVSRHWSERHLYASTGDWFMSIYNRVMIHSSKLPWPARRRVLAVRLASHAAPCFVRLGSSDWYVMEEIFIRGEYTPLTDRKLTEIRTIVDLGANIGMSLRLWRNHFPVAKIVAVEPDEDNLRMASMNAGDTATLLRACAASSSRKVYLDRSKAEWAFEMKDAPTATSVELDALTIPQVLERAGLGDGIDLLKCDIEGAEAELFADCGEWIAKVREMVVEIHAPYTSEMLLDHLRSGGAEFEIYHTSSKGDHSVIFLSRRQIP